MPRTPDPAQGTREPTRNALGAFTFRHLSVTLVTLAAALVLVGLLADVLGGGALWLDALANELLVARLRSDALTPLMRTVTSLGSVAVLAVMAAVIAALVPVRAAGWCASVNLACVVALNTLLKELIRRPRPDVSHLVEEAGYSFPSGHAMAAMAFFGLLAWMVWRLHGRGAARVAWCALFSLVIALVGVSRVYLGVHYASDVVAGYCASILWLVLYTRVVVPRLIGTGHAGDLAQSGRQDDPPTPPA